MWWQTRKIQILGWMSLQRTVDFMYLSLEHPSMHWMSILFRTSFHSWGGHLPRQRLFLPLSTGYNWMLTSTTNHWMFSLSLFQMKHLLHHYYNGSYTSSWRHQLCFLVAPTQSGLLVCHLGISIGFPKAWMDGKAERSCWLSPRKREQSSKEVLL